MNTTEKRVPLRMCAGCRQMKPKSQLIRVVKCGDDAQPTVDLTGKANGRGCYFCKDADCIGRAKKNKNFGKQFGFNIDERLFAELESAIER